MPKLITLTSDFGMRDPYVAAMKGVVRSVCPGAEILDLSHEIAPQNVLEGALFIAGSAPYFPVGAIHVIVVDPGVGSARRAVAVAAGGQTFVYPDNGLLTLFLRRCPVEEARVIAERRFMHEPVSTTFHGRDVFAPAAAHLARGVPLRELGPPTGDLIALDAPEPRASGDHIRGEVLHADHFGNLITNVPEAMIDGPCEVVAGGASLPLQRTYSDVPIGKPLALIGSTGFVEISVNGGSAARELGLGTGAAVEVDL